MRRFSFTLVFTFLSIVLFAQDDVKSDLNSLFLGLNVESKPEKMIIGLPLKFEKFLRKQEQTGEPITIYIADFQKDDRISSKLLNGEVRIEQKNYEVELGRHSVFLRLAFQNYDDLIEEYTRLYTKFEGYASNIMTESPENENDYGRQISNILTIKDDFSVKKLSFVYLIPNPEEKNKTQYLFVDYSYRRY
ncbi:hypothetical protein HNP38_002331 [Chryseobacterium defluvii]|uniref:Uncharacterized protein n=1 Tax=Chryseobacterium defluvii TaxID=160396 RepID=A0A840KGC5_9FLAO|nr:hypothetical protein [Chryseobacterium defluvii]MBB4807027.1 hypothetical protein [Chryseobacterium defluvii]